VEELKISVTPRQKDPIFEDEQKAKELARLLKSKNPQDLEMANKLIKNMVKQVIRIIRFMSEKIFLSKCFD